MNEPRLTDAQTNDGVREAASPADQIQAQNEQTMERLQDEVDAVAIDEEAAEAEEPEDLLRTWDQVRLYEAETSRNTHA